MQCCWHIEINIKFKFDYVMLLLNTCATGPPPPPPATVLMDGGVKILTNIQFSGPRQQATLCHC